MNEMTCGTWKVKRKRVGCGCCSSCKASFSLCCKACRKSGSVSASLNGGLAGCEALTNARDLALSVAGKLGSISALVLEAFLNWRHKGSQLFTYICDADNVTVVLESLQPDGK